MMRSMYSAVSGLKTHQTKMDVIGNNVANVNTVAFKSSSVTFSEIMYQTISGASGANAATGTGGVNAKQIGLGVTTGSTTVSISTAGASQTTGNPFDIKLTDANSTNFFVVNNGSENLFTRAGSFYVDGSGNLCMSSTGYTLQGWQVDATTGTIRKDTVSALQVMNTKNQTSAPEATTNAYVSGILDKATKDLTNGGLTMNLNFYDSLGYSYTAKFVVKPTDTDTGEYTVELSNIYDSQNNDILKTYLDNGNNLSSVFGMTESPYTLTADYSYTGGAYTYTTGGNTYNLTPSADGLTYTYLDATNTTQSVTLQTMYGVTDTVAASIAAKGADVKIAADGTASVTNKYALKFSPDDGTFTYVGAAGSSVQGLNMSALGGQFENINVDFSGCKNSNNSGTSTLAASAGTSSSDTTGKGKKLGALTGLSIDTSGQIWGSYDNGNTVLLCQIATAQFANASGLEKVGENCYTTTLNSGDFDGIGVAVSADGSKMTSGQLEMSNVDLSSEFTDMITTQRGFQANSRVITTSDTLLEELVNLKR